MLWGVWYPEAAKTTFPKFGVKTPPRFMEIKHYHPNAFQNIIYVGCWKSEIYCVRGEKYTVHRK